MSERSVLGTFLDAHVDAGCGAAVALSTPSESITYADLAVRVRRAGSLLRDLGVEPEQRVAMLLGDGAEFAATFFAAIAIGAVPVPMNTRLSAQDYRGMLLDSRAKVLVAGAALHRPIEAELGELPDLRHVLLVGGGGERDFARSLARADANLVERAMSDEDTAFWLYSSGTTGTPKAVVHSRRTLFAYREYGVDVLGASAADRVFATSKLFFAYALGNALLIPLAVGGQSFLLPWWADLSAVEGVLREFRPTLFFSVPTLYARLLRADLPKETFASVRIAVSAGERLPVEIYDAWNERFSVPLLDGIGATETVFMFLSNRLDRRKAGSSGVPIPGTDARILDAEGREVPTGEQGVLWVRSPSAAIGYWRRLEATRQIFVGDRYCTRDVYHRDEDGFYFYHGREDDFFKVAAQWVIPTNVEKTLLAHPAVLEAAVVGAEDRMGLVKAVAFVVPKDSQADRAALAREVALAAVRALSPHERPRRVIVTTELPRTATGKLQRFKLHETAVAALRAPEQDDA